MKYTHYHHKTVYPQDIECVWESGSSKGAIFVGNLEASQNIATLKKHGIKAVLTAAKDINLRHPKSEIPYHLHVPGEDHQHFDLSKYFNVSIDFIADSLKETNILVHCMAGISRSVTLVLAYLMKHHRLSYSQAFEAVRRRRRIINPNRGFMKQLQEFERVLEKEKQVLRRSHDNFQSYSLQNSIYRPQNPQTSTRQTFHQSIKKTTDNSYTYTSSRKNYKTFCLNEEEENCPREFTFNSKHHIPKRQIKDNFGDLNRELDEKIAGIRKKYMEATDLLNRQDKKRGSKQNPRSYFNEQEQSQLGKKVEDVQIKKVYQTGSMNTRATSFADYSNPRKMQGYLSKNY